MYLHSIIAQLVSTPPIGQYAAYVTERSLIRKIHPIHNGCSEPISTVFCLGSKHPLPVWIDAQDVTFHPEVVPELPAEDYLSGTA